MILKPLEKITRSIKEKGIKGGKPYIEIGDIDVQNKRYSHKDKLSISGCLLARKGHILVSKVRPTRGAISLIQEHNICVSSAFTILDSLDKKIALNKFIFYMLAYNNNFLDYLGKRQKGALYPGCKEKDILRFEIPVPSVSEQERVIDILDKAEIIRNKRRETLRLADQFLKSTFLEMFGDPKKENRWNLIDFGEIIEVLTDYHANGSYEILRNHVELKSTPDYALMVRTTDLENNNFTDDVKYISKEAYEFLQKSKVYGGEIIINKIGSAGNVYLMPDLNRPVSLGMNAFLLRFNEQAISVYIYYLLTSVYGKGIINHKVKGAVTKTIRKDAIRSLKIPLPPIVLQQKFADLVQKVERLNAQQRASAIELDNLFHSLMQRAFRGELFKG
jgi:type I restriction enzyme, S subunit